jgi:hypothetical protein
MTYSRDPSADAVRAHKAGPDPSWNGLYQIGGICGLLHLREM